MCDLLVFVLSFAVQAFVYFVFDLLRSGCISQCSILSCTGALQVAASGDHHIGLLCRG